MLNVLNDDLTLRLLENICSGTGVSVNISELSKSLKKHRKTIKDAVGELIKYKIINSPIYPFIYLYDEYPLIVMARVDFPKDEKTEKFIVNDDHIFTAYRTRDEHYNTFLIEYHKDLHHYQLWKNSIIRERKITSTDARHPTDTCLVSSKLIIKYKPYEPVYVMEKEFREQREMKINGYELTELSVQILKKLLMGEGIRTNENLLAEKLKVHRRTVEHRISALLKEKIILNHICRFPNFFVPPSYVLVYSLLEIKCEKSRILKAIDGDPHIPVAFVVGAGLYNVLVLGAFSNVEGYQDWEEEYDNKFPGCLGATKKVYLLPKYAYPIDQQKISLAIIKQKRKELHGEKLIEKMK